MTTAPLARLRAICLSMPEAAEKETWQTPTFRIRDRIFAMVHTADGRLGVWCKAPSGAQAILIEAAPDRFFRPPYLGPKGWIGIWLDDPDWVEIAVLVARSYAMTAPKRLLSTPADRQAEPSRRKLRPSRPRSIRRRAVSAR